jgi:ATP-binding cassette, subfamily B, bacterial
MFLMKSGASIDIDALRREVTITAPGLTLLSLKNLAQAHGVRTIGLAVKPSGLPRLTTPWVAHLKSGVGHYVVVENVSLGRVTVADPARGRLLYSQTAFELAWSGNALVMDPN